MKELRLFIIFSGIVLFLILGINYLAIAEEIATVSNVSENGAISINGKKAGVGFKLNSDDELEVKIGEVTILYNDESIMTFGEGIYTISLGSIKINIKSDIALIKGNINTDCNIQAKLFRANLEKGEIYIKLDKKRARIQGNVIDVQEAPGAIKEIIKENKIVEVFIEPPDVREFGEDRIGEDNMQSSDIQEFEQDPETQPRPASPFK